MGAGKRLKAAPYIRRNGNVEKEEGLSSAHGTVPCVFTQVVDGTAAPQPKL